MDATSSNISKRKVGRGKHSYWEHAEDTTIGSKRSFRCKYCNDEFGGGATRLNKHLSKKKGGGIRPCPNVPDNVVEKISGCKRAFSEVENENSSRPLSSSSDRNNRPRIGEGEENERLNALQDTNDKLALFLLTYRSSNDFLEFYPFIDFVMAVARFGSDYKLPNSDAIEEVMCNYKEKVKSYVEKFQESSVEAGFTLARSSQQMFAYSSHGGLCVYCPRSDAWKIRDKKIIINEYVDSVGEKNVLQIFLEDNSIKEFLVHRYPWMNVGRSPTDEILNLVCVDDLMGLKYTLSIASKIGSQMDINSSNWMHLVTLDSPIETCDTLSEWFMGGLWCLHQLLKHKVEGGKFIFSGITNLNHYIYCGKFWSQAKEWDSIFQPILRAHYLLSDKESPASGYVYEMMKKVSDAIDKCHHIAEYDMKRLRARFGEVRGRVVHPLYAAAAFLNPIYMRRRSFQGNAELITGIEFILRHLVETTEEGTFRSELNRYCSKESDIFTPDAKSALEFQHPAKWWKAYGKSVPTLQKYAIRILSQPCYFLDVFYPDDSHECDVVDKYCISTNATLMEYFRTEKTEDLRAIDVNNIGLPHWLQERPATKDDYLRVSTDYDILTDVWTENLIKCPYCKADISANLSRE